MVVDLAVGPDVPPGAPGGLGVGQPVGAAPPVVGGRGRRDHAVRGPVRGGRLDRGAGVRGEEPDPSPQVLVDVAEVEQVPTLVGEARRQRDQDLVVVGAGVVPAVRGPLDERVLEREGVRAEPDVVPIAPVIDVRLLEPVVADVGPVRTVREAEGVVVVPACRRVLAICV